VRKFGQGRRTRRERVIVAKISWTLKSDAARGVWGRARPLKNVVCNTEVAGEDFFV
jgi:hypothetical protein